MSDRRSFLASVAALPAMTLPVLEDAAGQPSSPAPKRLATAIDYASIDFQAIPPENISVFGRDVWIEAYDSYVYASNVAVRLLGKNKAEMVALARPLMDDEGLELIQHMRSTLEDAERILKTLAEPMEKAAIRLLAACCTVECEGES